MAQMLEVNDENDVGDDKDSDIPEGNTNQAYQALDLTCSNKSTESATSDSEGTADDNDNGALIECPTCQEQYRSLARLRQHIVTCGTNLVEHENNSKENPNQEKAQITSRRMMTASPNSTQSSNTAHHGLKSNPPPLIRMVQPSGHNSNTIVSHVPVPQPGYVHRISSDTGTMPVSSTISQINSITTGTANGSVSGQLQQNVNSSHLNQRHLHQLGQHLRGSQTHAINRMENQVVASNGKPQQSINGRTYPNRVPNHLNSTYSAQPLRVITEMRKPMRYNGEPQHNNPRTQLSIMLPPDAELSPTDNGCVEDGESTSKGVLKEGRMERVRKRSQETWGKIKTKCKKRAKVAEQKRIKKLMTIQTGAKPFKCNICKRSFSKSFRAKRHIMTHLGVRPFKCTICYKSFNQAQTLKDHVKYHKPGQGQHNQSNTDESLPAQEHLANNMQNSILSMPVIELEEVPEETEKLIQAQIQEADKPYKCGTCPMQFARYMELERHVAEHRAQNMFHCNVCNKTLASRFMLDQHLKWHREKKHFYPCDKCPKTFYHTEGLNEHMAMSHNEGSITSKDTCVDKQTFLSADHAQAQNPRSNGTLNPYSVNANQETTYQNGHVNSFLPSQGMAPQAVQCYYPNSYNKEHITKRYYDTTESMSSSSYENISTTTDSLYHECVDANDHGMDKQQISFKLQKIQMNASSMIEIKTRTPRRYFKCQICTSTFYKDAEFNKHMTEHEEGMTFTCMACDITFSTSSELNRHYATHPGVRPYKCTVCDKAFIQATHLKFHMRRHTGEKPFQCKVCYKRFPRHAHLQEHMYLHAGEKLHRCTVCDKRFTQPTGLRSHMKRTHPGQIKQTHKCPHCPVSFESKQARSLHILNVHQEEDMVSSTTSTSTSTSTMTDDSTDSSKRDKNQRLYEDLSNGQNFKQIIALPVKMMADKIVVFYEDKLLMEWTYDNKNN